MLLLQEAAALPEVNAACMFYFHAALILSSIIASAQQGKIDAGKAIHLAAHGSRLRGKELRVGMSHLPPRAIREHASSYAHYRAYVSIRQHTLELGVCMSHLLRRAIRDLYTYT